MDEEKPIFNDLALDELLAEMVLTLSTVAGVLYFLLMQSGTTNSDFSCIHAETEKKNIHSPPFFVRRPRQSTAVVVVVQVQRLFFF